MDLPGVGRMVWSVVEWASKATTIAAALTVLVVVLAFRIYPTWRLIHLSLFRQQAFGWLHASMTVLQCLAYAFKSDGLYKTARLRIELEVLHPRPVLPFRRRSAEAWRRVKRRHKRRLRGWKQALGSDLARLTENARGTSPVITVDTCFDL